MEITDIGKGGEGETKFLGGSVVYGTELGCWVIGYGYLFDHYKNSGIIGNIHENPDLLTPQ